ncbi:MAG: Ferrichrome-iron receptor [uncultured Cytophagales bacterium]|uniref:Ferrichrome-iron receptor n=1 Tax=uncultured Cytophagales bacterium TaxID=158755 RepID=A0A6J4JZD4_9SPHI|nr:MAG: Ferrichrome-iron receptor [uncultured Cytophagales bacterium]
MLTPPTPLPRTIPSLSFFLFLVGLLPAHAQTAAIRGRIRTSDGQPAAYVNVALKQTARGTTTDEGGHYGLTHLAEGAYTVVTSAVGLQTQEKAVTVTAGQLLTLDFVLAETAQQLSEVVVTAHRSPNEAPVSIGKIAIRPLDLPQSVIVIDRQLMDQQQVLRVSDVLHNTSGVYVMGTTGGTQEEIAGRGFAFGSNNTFKNGVRFNNGVMPETSSLERAEVLKGSNAILFGNVAAGGVLNLVTKKPKFGNGGQLSMRAGSFGFYKPALDLYGAVNGSRHLAYRINTTYETAGSFRDEVRSERFYINPSLLAKIGPKTELLLEGDYLKDNRTPDYGVGAVNYRIAEVPRSRFLGVSWANYRVAQQSATLTLTHRLRAGWQVKAVGGYQGFSGSLYTTGRPSTVQPDGKWVRSLQRTQTDEQYFLGQIDVTGGFNTGFLGHSLLIGADADQYRTQTPAFNVYADPRNPSRISPLYDSINVFNPGEYPQRADIPQATRATLAKNLTGRGGVYVQDLVRITDQVKLLAGVRFSYLETRSEAYRYDETGALTLNPTAANHNQPIAANYYHAVTPRAGLVYQPLNTTALFASYANSFNLNTGIDNTGKPLPPSLVNQYEAGVKNDLFKGLLSANVTLYRIVNGNLNQTIQPDSPDFNAQFPNAQELAGEVTSQGLEVDLMSKPFRGFSFVGGYSYNQTRYTRSNTYAVGSRLRYNPNHTANASVFYAFGRGRLKGLDTGFTGFYVGNMLAGRNPRLTVADDPYRLIALPSFLQLDVSAGYTFGGVSLRGRLTNLLDAPGYYAHDDNSINPVAPRQFALTLAYQF